MFSKHPMQKVFHDISIKRTGALKLHKLTDARELKEEN